MDVVDRVPGLAATTAGAEVRADMEARRAAARAHTRQVGDDPPEVRDWAWRG
jgi:xylulose-5-phosphate/fructose-6-phosphate phosphoketolase